MAAPQPPRAWLLLAAGDDRGHGGNSGYDDEPDSFYSWDSTVANHKQLSVGDVIVIWDKVQLIGTSVIEEISSGPGLKELQRCPNPKCSTTRIAVRKKSLPIYRCMKCGNAFDLPRPDVVPVTRYVARYDAAWTSLEGLMDAAELRAVQVHSLNINAMRPLDWRAFEAKLAARHASTALLRVNSRIGDAAWPSATSADVEFVGGFRHSLARVRRGQQAFRAHLFDTQGTICAMTGPAPAVALEAGHLYSYARLGEHHEHGGLLLRRDVHRLFDDGFLAVNPGTLRIDTSAKLDPFPQYAQLAGHPLAMPLRDAQVEWVAKHWQQHRVAYPAH